MKGITILLTDSIGDPFLLTPNAFLCKIGPNGKRVLIHRPLGRQNSRCSMHKAKIEKTWVVPL
jgi:hypothetical protein